MESRTLFNWYNEEFEIKIPESVENTKDYKRQARQVLERRLDRLSVSNKVNKDLYLRAKTKLSYDKKRALVSLKTSYKSKERVLRESLKQLKLAKTIESLLKYEIRKSKTNRKSFKHQVSDYYQWLTKTIDEADQKIISFKETIVEYKGKEIKEITKQIYFGLLKHFYKVQPDDFVLINFFDNVNQEGLSQFEKNYISSSIFSDVTLIKIYNKLKLTVDKSNKKFHEIKLKIQKDSQKNKHKYLVDKKNLKLDFKKRVLNAEYSYNKENESKKVLAKSDYKEKLKLISKNSNKFDQIIKTRKNKIFSYKYSLKKSEKKVKQNYKLFNIVEKKSFAISYKIDILKLISNHIRSLDLSSVIQAKENYLNLLKTRANHRTSLHTDSISKKEIKIQDDNLKQQFNVEYEKVKNIIKTFSAIEKKKINFVWKSIFNYTYKRDAKQVHFAKIKSEYFGEIGAIKKNYSYDGDFQIKKSHFLNKWNKDWGNAYNEMIIERIKSKSKMIDLKSTSKEQRLINRKNYRIEKSAIKKDYANNIKIYKKLYKTKKIQKIALKTKKYELGILKKEQMRSLLLSSEFKKVKSAINTFFIRYKNKKKVYKKVYDSKVAELVKEIPRESKKNIRWLGMLLNLFIPGLAETILFKQRLKGTIMLVISGIFYGFLVPFSFGFIWTKMGGIFGLIDMGASIHNWAKGIVPDARYYLLGGVISIILMTALVVYLIISSISAYKVGKSMEEGSRPSTWTHTKRWLNNEGFPWMISMPGWFLIIFIVITPIVTSLLISFTNMGFNHEPPGRKVSWVGLSQYGKWWTFRNVGMAKSIFRVLSWTIVWTISSSALVIFLGTLFAVLVNKHRVKLKKMWRMIYIIPWAIPAFVTIMFLKSAFQPDKDSLINLVLLNMHLIKKPINWFSGIWTVRIILIIIQGWLGHAYIFLLITGNMQSIPKNIYEAGSIDGAKGNQMFRYLTAPALLASIAPLLITQFTFAFNNFTIISLFSGGGPAFTDPTPFLEGGTDILISWIYKLTTGIAQIDGNIAFSAAMTTIAAMISVSIAAYGFSKSTAMRGE